MFYAAENASSWTAFIQQAEEVAWLVYPDKILNRISNNQTLLLAELYIALSMEDES